jgi:hypothetical protein
MRRKDSKFMAGTTVEMGSRGRRLAPIREKIGALLVFAAATAAAFALPLMAQQAGPMRPDATQDAPPASAPLQAAPQSAAQPADAGPMTKPAASGIRKDPPAQPVDQIIQTFAQHEAEFKQERDNFTYTQDFVIQTIGPGDEPDGEYRMTTDITYTQDGKRNENITYAPPPTLERISLSEQDLDDIRNVQPFVLTTAELPKYDVSYVGREKVDEIGTYVFDVAPKKIEKNQRYFQGRIWVDDRDLEIVKTDGKAVPDIHKGDNENIFPRFVTYRENIEGHYWFPTYTRSDDTLHFQSGPVRIRMSVRYKDYKRFRVTMRLVPATTQPVDNPPASAPVPPPPPPSSTAPQH